MRAKIDVNAVRNKWYGAALREADMRLGILPDVTGNYLPSEAWIYDRYIAPAVMAWVEKATADLAPVLAEARSLLDVGCGGGHLLTTLAARHPRMALQGIDLSENQVARANKRLREASGPESGGAGGADRVVQGTALELPYRDGTFDVVVSIASIKHWPDQARGLSECCRVLRPGGSLLVVEVDRGTRLEDLRSFIWQLHFPRTVKPMLPLMVPFIRTFVHGQSIDLDELRALSDPLPLEGMKVERLPGTSAMRLFGRKRADVG